jgi:hypothetical protein
MTGQREQAAQAGQAVSEGKLLMMYKHLYFFKSASGVLLWGELSLP